MTCCVVDLRAQWVDFSQQLPEHLAECEAEILHYRPKIALFQTIRYLPAPFAFIWNIPKNKRLKTARNSMNFVLGRCYNALNNRYFAFVTFKTPKERAENKSGIVNEICLITNLLMHTRQLISSEVAVHHFTLLKPELIYVSPQCNSVFTPQKITIRLMLQICFIWQKIATIIRQFNDWLLKLKAGSKIWMVIMGIPYIQGIVSG